MRPDPMGAPSFYNLHGCGRLSYFHTLPARPVTMTIVTTMTLIGLLGLALHLGFYWAAGGLVVLFMLCRSAAKKSQRKGN